LDAPDGPPSRYVSLTHAALSTSGDAFQFVEIDGVRYSHIVDPRTGLGISGPSAATVIARDCTAADSLATAVCVLGPERGLGLVQSTAGAQAIYLYIDGSKMQCLATAGFEEFEVDLPLQSGCNGRN
jgi:thiamine biosynthesis lipoprotein